MERLQTNIYVRDEEWFKNNGTIRTDINKGIINLDNYTMMNTAYSKYSFTDKSICEVIIHIFPRVNVKFDYTTKFKSEWHKYDHHFRAIG